MTLDQPHQLTALTRQRDELAAQLSRVRKAHCVAVLDYVTAKVRHACPEAEYIEFSYHGQTRDLGVLGVLGEDTTRSGSLPLLWEKGEMGHSLTWLGSEIEINLQNAMEPYDSLVWTGVRRNTARQGNSWLLQLPPLDRVARVAQLVREFHSRATSVIADGGPAGIRVVEVIEENGGNSRRRVRPCWTEERDEALARLVAHVFALPALADRHLLPVGHIESGAYTGFARRIPLPPTA